MYIFKGNLKINLNKTQASEEIGISRPYLSAIMNCKRTCTKIVAYCITKFIDDNAEIEDYFEEI